MLYAALDTSEARHGEAGRALDRALGEEPLITHNYVVVEATILVRSRLGAAATRVLTEDLLAPVRIEWVTEELHRAATGAMLAAIERTISLVDWTSFELMRQAGIHRALALDRHFEEQGFSTVP